MCAFAVSIASGLITSVEPMTVLLRSVVVLIVASAIGRVLGRMALVAMNEHLTATTAGNPVPETISLSAAASPDTVDGIEVL